MRGEADQAFAALQRAYDEHDADLVDIKADIFLKRLHGDARFKTLLKKMNLPE